MVWIDKLLSRTALVKAKNKQLQQYSNQIDYLTQRLTAVNEDLLEGDNIYAIIAWQKAKLCGDFFEQLKNEQQKNEKLENEILALKHMLDRYEEELEK